MELEVGKSNIIHFPILKANGPLARPYAQSHDGTIGPIEREMRTKLARLKGCKYPDTFDWSVYDRIASKFDQPPRGGVVFNTTFKLVNWHPTCSKCHYALEIDTYGRGCYHDCGYCYAKDRLTTRGYWNAPQPFPVDLAEIRKAFYTVFETDKTSKWRELLARRIPLRIGSMSDSFMWLDVKYGVTKELLKILKYYQYPNVIFTRSDLVAHDDYIDLMDPSLSTIQFSISGNNHSLMRRLEPGAPSSKRRFIAIRKLSDRGFWTAVRVNPLFPTFPDGYFTDKEYIQRKFGQSVPRLDISDDSFIAQISESGAKTLIAGFVRLSGHAVDAVARAGQIDFRKFFREYKPGNSDNSYSTTEISVYYKAVSSNARKYGLRFTTCYIGTGHSEYENRKPTWSNKADCCDILGNVPGFKATSQNIDWSIRKQHATYKDMASQAESFEINLEDPRSSPSSTLDLS